MSRLSVGDRVGPYRIIGHLVGNTYRAAAIGLAQRYLLEVAPIDHWREAAIHMMRAERIAETLLHPGVARIVDRGVLADRRSWMVTEIPSGLGLYELIARRALPAPETTALIRDVAEVLEHAHDRGVLHRALTLRSIVLATGARQYPVAICDWGLPPQDFGVFGAPELATGTFDKRSESLPSGGIDGRTDVYALGVIAYRAMTMGFPDDDATTDLTGVPVGLAALVGCMLAADPEARPTAAEVRARATDLLGRVERSVVPAAVAVVADVERAAARRALTPPIAQPTVELPLPAPASLDDVVHAAPRFKKPKWTPSPMIPITSERFAVVAGEIDGDTLVGATLDEDTHDD